MGSHLYNLQLSIIGEWELKEFTITNPLGIKSAWDSDVNGILMYTSSGYMSVSINGNKNQTGKFLSYAGTYEIKEGCKIMHCPISSSDTNRIGTTLIREAILDGDQLTLISRGDFGTARLCWQKINFQATLKSSNFFKAKL